MNKLQRQLVIKEFEQYLNIFETEIVFSSIMQTKRKFRADYYIKHSKIIIEINGGQYINGRHNRGGKGYENDLTKLNLAQKNGFAIYQFTYEMLLKQEYKKYF